MVDVTLSDLGGEIEEATVSFWQVEPGEHVEQGADIVEVITEKATFKVQAPCAGIIAEILVLEGEVVLAGNILARIHEEGG